MTKKVLRLIAMHNHFKILKQSCFEWLCFLYYLNLFVRIPPYFGM